MKIIKYFNELYSQKNQLNLLNWAYWVIISVSIVLAAILAIFNQSLGAALLIIPILCLASICLNMFVWRIIESIAKKKTKSKIYKSIVKIDKMISKHDRSKSTKKSQAKRYSKSSR